MPRPPTEPLATLLFLFLFPWFCIAFLCAIIGDLTIYISDLGLNTFEWLYGKKFKE